MPDDVQPSEGQGTDGGSPFDSYLQEVPTEAREAAEKWFSDTSKGLNGKLEEAAEFKKQWEPYVALREQLPEPDQLQELVTWANSTLQDEQTFDQWVTQLAESKGMTKAEAEEEVQEEEDQTGLSAEQIQQIAQEQITPYQEQLEELRFERGVDVETEQIRSKMSSLEDEAKVKLTEEQRGDVYDLGMRYAKNEQGEELPVGDTSWLDQGFEHYMNIGRSFTKEFVEDKASQPASAMTAGGQPAMKPILSFQDANEALRERLRANQAT